MPTYQHLFSVPLIIIVRKHKLTNPYSVVRYELQRPLDSSFILFFGFTLIRHIRDTESDTETGSCIASIKLCARAVLTTSSFASSVSKGFRLLRATVKLQEQQTNLDDMIPTEGQCVKVSVPSPLRCINVAADVEIAIQQIL